MAANRWQGVSYGRAALMASAMRLGGRRHGGCGQGAGAAALATAMEGMCSRQARHVSLDNSLSARNSGDEGSCDGNQKEQRSVHKNNICDNLYIPL